MYETNPHEEDGRGGASPPLPNEVVLRVMSHLDLPTLATTQTLCRAWSTLATHNSLWQGLIKKRIRGENPVPKMTGVAAQHQQPAGTLKPKPGCRSPQEAQPNWESTKLQFDSWKAQMATVIADLKPPSTSSTILPTSSGDVKPPLVGLPPELTYVIIPPPQQQRFPITAFNSAWLSDRELEEHPWRSYYRFLFPFVKKLLIPSDEYPDYNFIGTTTLSNNPFYNLYYSITKITTKSVKLVIEIF